MIRLIHRLFPALALVALGANFALAQPASRPENGQQQSTAIPPVSAPALSQPAYLTPIAGYQGVLVETVDGQKIAEQVPENRFNPASAVKLATALVALQSFGPQHRFLTGVWAMGSIDKASGTLNGDLVITGRDPSFRYEDAVMIARQLNEAGVRNVTGNLIVAPAFTLNFDWSASRSGSVFRDTLDTSRRSTAAVRAWVNERTILGDKQSLSTVPSVSIAGEVQVNSAPPGAVTIFNHKSSKLVDVLKALLCYSNNFMAERIGDALGGPEGVVYSLANRLSINTAEISLASTSGLGVNRVTPRTMMRILRALRTELAKYKLTLADILPVAGVDPGTLQDRYTDSLERGSVVAKTGTLIRTDGGVSALVGQMRTKSGRVVLFVIMNQGGNVSRFRQNQDQIVTAIQNSLGGPAPFEYHPVELTLRLAGPDYEAAKARGEVEPKEEQ